MPFRTKLTPECRPTGDWKGNLSHAPFLPLMTDDTPKLGRCPECEENISAAYILVEYEKNDGTTGIWAECPSCDDVVNPDTE